MAWLRIHYFSFLQIKSKDSKADQSFVSSVSNWPHLLYTNFHDLYYNKDDKSEQIDKELAKIQQVGQVFL